MRTRFTHRTRTLTLAAALACAGLLPAAAPAHAQGGWRDRGDDGYGRYGDRRGGYGDRGEYGRRGYGDRGYGDTGRTRDLARQLARQTHGLLLEAQRVNPRPSPPVAQMLASLHRLDQSAARLERSLAYGGGGSRYEYRGDSRGGYRGSDLGELLAAYDDLRYALGGINPQRYLREGIASIDALVGEISRTDRYAGRDGYGRYGEGRYGRGGDGYGPYDRYDDPDGYPRR